jgi:hypothetical protein
MLAILIQKLDVNSWLLNVSVMYKLSWALNVFFSKFYNSYVCVSKLFQHLRVMSARGCCFTEGVIKLSTTKKSEYIAYVIAHFNNWLPELGENIIFLRVLISPMRSFHFYLPFSDVLKIEVSLKDFCASRKKLACNPTVVSCIVYA